MTFQSFASKIRITLLLLTTSLVLGGANLKNEERKSPLPGRSEWVFRSFPIGGWYGPKDTEKALRQYLAANFNIAMMWPRGSSERREKAVALAEKLGLPVLLHHQKVDRSPFSKKVLAEVLEAAKRHPNIVGVLLWDEPSPESFASIADWTAALRAARPDLLPWVNLHAMKIVEEELPGVTQYGPYVDGYVETVKPLVLSYDNYGALRESNDDRFFYKNFEDTYFYHNMAIFRDRSLKYDLPFWGFPLVNPHWTYFTPSEMDIRFQVYSLLAYGAKGLWYFTYDTTEGGISGPNLEGAEIESALVNKDGSVTSRYSIVQRINAEVKALGPTLLGLTSVGIHHLDKPKLPGTHYLEDPKETLPLSRDPLPQDGYLTKVTGGRPLVGLFEDGEGSEYFLVMNKNRRKMSVVTRIELGLDRHRDLLKPGHTLGQKFTAAKPISAVSLLASSYSGVGHGATIRIRKGGVAGEVVAAWTWRNLFADNAVILRFDTQPAGDYYIELDKVVQKTGWWSKDVPGQGGAYVDGKPVPGVARNFIAFGAPDFAAEAMTLVFAPDVTAVQEVRKTDGRLIKQILADGKLTLTVAQGDGHLFKVTRKKP